MEDTKRETAIPKSGLGIQRDNKGKGRTSLTGGARELLAAAAHMDCARAPG